MVHRIDTSYWQRKRFRPLFAEHWQFSGVEKSIERMREIIREDVIEYELVCKDLIGTYLKVVDALEMLTEALFDLRPKGIVRFELTREYGIKMLFKDKTSPGGKIFSVIDIGWIYDIQAAKIIEESLCQSSTTLKQLTSY